LETIRLKIDQTGLLEHNEKIHLKNATKEVSSLIKSYNQMIDELEISAKKLAIQEREQAWQEMAKQVAHEIKNPLTPMRLTVQSFEQRFSKNKSYNEEKIKEFCNILIEQIDTMSNVANTFSYFAALPKAKLEPSNIVEISKRSLEIFEQNEITFVTSHPEIFVKLDRTQWVRVMTNLIQNALQSVPKERKAKIKVEIRASAKNVKISFSDNGEGVSESIKDKIFEPKFTTKTKGMGLGLGIVKNIVDSHGGKINYSSGPKGTKFIITLKI
jgi:nitrogen fixation/metabolism regulation signal transduction histidine kinase